jgi:hypothetical protein
MPRAYSGGAPLLDNPLYYIPVGTTVLSLAFTWVVYRRYREKDKATHLLWWTLGILVFGVGTFTEAWTALFGWNQAIFRGWYISGALLGGAPLAQGTVYLLLARKTADRLAIALVLSVLICSVFVLLTPLDAAIAQEHKLKGDVIDWTWIRWLTPFLNLYAFIFLVGGAAYSAIKYRESRQQNRMIGNIFIAVGALLPGIGGSFTVFGFTEVLYVTEFIGIILIYAGYRYSISGRPPSPIPALEPLPA